jgi:hypothetical protein
MIVNQQTQTIADLWDGTQLTCTFRRTFTDSMMNHWLEILELARGINCADSVDQMIWKYKSNGVYSSKSLYAIVKFRGLPSFWELKIPPRVQNFLDYSHKIRF